MCFPVMKRTIALMFIPNRLFELKIYEKSLITVKYQKYTGMSKGVSCNEEKYCTNVYSYTPDLPSRASFVIFGRKIILITEIQNKHDKV